jgi:hypothetical protein
MDGRGYRSVRHGWWTIRKDLVKPVRRELANYGVKAAVMILSARRGSVCQRFVD